VGEVFVRYCFECLPRLRLVFGLVASGIFAKLDAGIEQFVSLAGAGGSDRARRAK
jgi:hypothetical protein